MNKSFGPGAANKTVAAGFSLRGKGAPVSRVCETRSSDAPVKGAATERNGAATGYGRGGFVRCFKPAELNWLVDVGGAGRDRLMA